MCGWRFRAWKAVLSYTRFEGSYVSEQAWEVPARSHKARGIKTERKLTEVYVSERVRPCHWGLAETTAASRTGAGISGAGDTGVLVPCDGRCLLIPRSPC